MDAFLAIDSKTPAGMYEFLTENTSFVNDGNIKTVEEKFETALGAKASGVQSVGAKLVFLRCCKEHGVEAFFDALSTHPPNEICKNFETSMKEMMGRVVASMKQ